MNTPPSKPEPHASPRTDEPTWRPWRAVAIDAADRARAETLARFTEPSVPDDKGEPGRFDPVTEADRQAEAAIRALLAARAADHGVDGEEFPPKPAGGPWRWTLDPVDGTRSFICGFPTWTTLIALAHDEQPVLGVIDAPVLDDRFIGDPDGATRERHGAASALQTRTCARLTDAIVAATAPDMFTRAEWGGFDMIAHAARLARFGADAYAYAMLAAGRVDLVVEAGLKPYDVRALIPVVRGAGGIITDWRGDPDRVHNGGQVIAAGDARVHQEALAVLARVAA